MIGWGIVLAYEILSIRHKRLHPGALAFAPLTTAVRRARTRPASLIIAALAWGLVTSHLWWDWP